MEKQEKIDKVVQYIKEGEKAPEDFKMGIEMEHFLVDKTSLESKGYFSENGVEDFFGVIEKQGFTPHKEGSHVLGLTRDDITITTEPAAQVEISIEKKKSLAELEKSYKKIRSFFLPILEYRGQELVTLGYHPKSKVDDIKILPKARYRYMYSYFGKQEKATGKYMMKGTASTQTSIDFSSEEDFKRKYFLASAISPILYSIFDNAYIFEGKPYEGENLREYIRQHCDKRRTNVYPFAFDKDLSYARYAQEILETDSIFINDGEKDVYTGEIPFYDILDKDYSEEMIFHALSIVRPDVRLKRYIEIRMPDALPYPLNFAFLALVKGIFYNDENISEGLKKYGDMTYEKYKKIREACLKKGIFASFSGEAVYSHALFLINLAEKGLNNHDKAYLAPLKQMVALKRTPKSYFKEYYKKDPRDAVKRFSVGYYD